MMSTVRVCAPPRPGRGRPPGVEGRPRAVTIVAAARAPPTQEILMSDASATATAVETKTVTLTIDGTPVTVNAGTSVWEAARRASGKTIPALCHSHYMGLNPVGVCRVCVVDILNKGKSGGNYAASCMRECEEGMEVQT